MRLRLLTDASASDLAALNGDLTPLLQGGQGRSLPVPSETGAAWILGAVTACAGLLVGILSLGYWPVTP